MWWAPLSLMRGPATNPGDYLYLCRLGAPWRGSLNWNIYTKTCIKLSGNFQLPAFSSYFLRLYQPNNFAITTKQKKTRTLHYHGNCVCSEPSPYILSYFFRFLLDLLTMFITQNIYKCLFGSLFILK